MVKAKSRSRTLGGSSVSKKHNVPVSPIRKKTEKKTRTREKVKNAKIILANYFKGINIFISNVPVHQKT